MNTLKLVKENIYKIIISKYIYMIFLFIIFSLFNYVFIYIFQAIYISEDTGIMLYIVRPVFMNNYPSIIFAYPISYIIFPIFFILIVCIYFTDEIQKRTIILHLFHGFSRKEILFSKWISINLLIIIMLLATVILSLIIGLPLRYLYNKSSQIYATATMFPVLIPPLNLNIIILSLKLFLFQYIYHFTIINVAFLFSIIFKNKIKVVAFSFISYLIFIFIRGTFPSLAKFTFVFYVNKFIFIEHQGDYVDVTYLSSKECILGTIVCISTGYIIYLFAKFKFLNTDL